MIKPMAAVDVWRICVLAVPVTTFPVLPLGETVVKPLSALPLTLLIWLLLIANRFKWQLHNETKVLFYFTFYCSVVPLVKSILLFGGGAIMTYLRSILTLIIGILFYSVFRIMNGTKEELYKTESLLQAGLVISVCIGIMQLTIRRFIPDLSIIPDGINYFFVEVATIWNDRAHGLAYEPSWLASQLTLIAFPLSVARLLSKESLGYVSTPLGKIRKEAIYAMFAVIGIIISGSRTGLFAIIFMLMVVGFSSRRRQSLIKPLISIILVIILVYVASMYSEYVGNVFSALYLANDFMEVVLTTNAAPRFSAWFTSYNVFISNPIFGVGLGNSFRFYSLLVPDWALNFSEASAWADGVGVPNAKNMLLKLLSETGLVGLIIFLYFISRHIFIFNEDYHLKILSRMILVALGFNYMSLDTFALPTEWFVLGYLISMKKIKYAQNINHHN